VEEAAQIAVGFEGQAVVLRVVAYVACYLVEQAVQRTVAAAEAADPIVAEGDPIAGSGAGTVGDIDFPCIAQGLFEDSLAVAADNLGEVVDNLEEAAGPDSPVGLDSLGPGGLVDDGHLKAAR
jgi:hypothetical protein